MQPFHLHHQDYSNEDKKYLDQRLWTKVHFSSSDTVQPKMQTYISCNLTIYETTPHWIYRKIIQNDNGLHNLSTINTSPVADAVRAQTQAAVSIGSECASRMRVCCSLWRKIWFSLFMTSKKWFKTNKCTKQWWTKFADDTTILVAVRPGHGHKSH